jgi:hypothetical protein
VSIRASRAAASSAHRLPAVTMPFVMVLALATMLILAVFAQEDIAIRAAGRLRYAGKLGMQAVSSLRLQRDQSSAPATVSPVVPGDVTAINDRLALSVDPAAIGAPGGSGGQAVTFDETFDNSPPGPTPWRPTNWDVTVHEQSRDFWRAFSPMHAGHGMDCSPPPSTHLVSGYDDAVFTCRDHVMTAINAGSYGLIYLTPNHLVDFSQGEAIIRFDVSTLRTSTRDWIDVLITPFDQNLQLSGDGNRRVDNAVNVFLNDGNVFLGEVYRNGSKEQVPGSYYTPYSTFLEPSASRRDTVEIRLSRTHLKVGMPAYNFWWVDAPIADLGWSQGTVSFGHHSYNPTKDRGASGRDEVGPNTWHWDNVHIAPAMPFTILRADRRYVDTANMAQPVTFAGPAPAGTYLRYIGHGTNMGYSLDYGQTWLTPVAHRPSPSGEGNGHFTEYWVPVPPGTQRIHFRGKNSWAAEFMAADMSLWSLAAPSASPNAPTAR